MTPHRESDTHWWKKTVVYQIYPRSYMDSNEDGIGDIPGIISKLDYVKEMGFETIWFSPFLKSPQFDHGYDISDYRSIAPEYGTMADFERLVYELHSRDMKIVMDMVLNHTSNQHPWFMESRSSRDSPKRNWYIWRDGHDFIGKWPPNNWRALTLGSPWHYDPATDQWYYGAFLPEQPDLNWRNGDVRQELFDVLRFWLQKGVDGFRLDLINSIYEELDFMKRAPMFNKHKHNLNHPDTLEFVKDLRRVVEEFSNPERFLVGEVTGPLPTIKKYYGGAVDRLHTSGLHLAFHFQTLKLGFSAGAYRRLFNRVERHFADPYMPTLLSTNHDRMRRISRLGNSEGKAKLSATFQLTARGVPFVYNGEEIGMVQANIPLKSAQDPMAKKFRWVPQIAVDIVAKRIVKESINRDECRTPMQWDSGPNAGFCRKGIKPWLPVTEGHEKTNVSEEMGDPGSILNCYKRLLQLRRDHPALNSGAFSMLKIRGVPKSLLAYERSIEEGLPERLQAFLNFGNRGIAFSAPESIGGILFSTHRNSNTTNGGKINLAPLEGIVAEVKK